MDDRKLRAIAHRSRNIRIELARRDPNVFMPLVLRDEETNSPIHQAPYHADWQSMISDHKRLVLWSHVESGKTQQISVGRVLWELGIDSTLRCVIVAATGSQATKITKSIARYIQESDTLRTIFPDLRPGKGGTAGAGWTQDAITIQRNTHAKDPSVQATCLHGNILGARIDLLILDDLLTFETTHTEYRREDTVRWIDSTLLGRLTRRGRVIFIGNAWHKDDAMHIMARRETWHGIRYPVMDEKVVTSNWQDRWPLDRIDDKRLELGPLEFERQMMCNARSDSDSRFKQADLDLCLSNGAGRQMVNAYKPRDGYRTYTGVDLAVKKSAGSHLTVIFTLVLHPDGTREVLNITSGRWSANEILTLLHDTQERYESLLVVESNAAQDFLVQMAEREGLTVRPFNTGRNKAHPLFGVESISAEMARGQWIIPSGNGDVDPEIRSWVDDMLYYDPKSHTGDRLMASWFAREAARKDMGTIHRVTAVGIDGQSLNDGVGENFSDPNLQKFWDGVSKHYLS